MSVKSLFLAGGSMMSLRPPPVVNPKAASLASAFGTADMYERLADNVRSIVAASASGKSEERVVGVHPALGLGYLPFRDSRSF